jgi:septal ring factor EnvC (AmiA/AmiB activator)
MWTCACLGVALCLLAAGTAARAEDKPNPDQLKKAYDDALVQLKSAQNSKSLLASENEKLARQVEGLKKQLAGAQGQVADLRRQVSDNDHKTFQLRAYQSAWRNFLHAHPELLARWMAFLADDALALPQERSSLLDFTLPLPVDAEPSEGG